MNDSVFWLISSVGEISMGNQTEHKDRAHAENESRGRARQRERWNYFVVRKAVWVKATELAKFLFLSFICLAVLGLSCSMWTLRCGMWDLVPWSGIKPGALALGARSLSHWITRESPLFNVLFHYGLSQDIEYSSLCYWVGPCCPSVLYVIVCIY